MAKKNARGGKKKTGNKKKRTGKEKPRQPNGSRFDSFRMEHPIEGLRPAAYNPRRITADALDNLKASITEVGFAKPIICTPDGLIIAGHQRTKAATALGITHVPAYVLRDVKEGDQIRFNQLHNGTDMEDINHPVFVAPSDKLGYAMVKPADIQCNMRSKGANIRAQMCKLINLYGPWGASVATQQGAVIGSPHYAICCKILGIDCRTYYIKNESQQNAKGWLTRQYGEFSYDHLPRNTYLQTFAQPMRLRGDSTTPGGNGQSLLYVDIALAELRKSDRILDFGCGQGDYVKFLRKLGYPIFGIEFFYRKGNHIDKRAVHKMIDDALADYATNGPFDVVVCDSVVNSVDTNEAEHGVLACVNAFCKLGGKVFFSGRTREGIVGGIHATKAACKKTTPRGCEFLDDEGYSGFYRKGNWFFQKFHSKQQVLEMGPRYFGENVVYTNVRGNEKSWQARCRKRIELPADEVERALRFEFDLMWPNGQSVGKAEEAVAAWKKAVGSA